MTIKRFLILALIISGVILPAAAGDFQPFDIGSSNASEQILVVMEKTEFKLGVLQGVADAFEGKSIRFHVEPFQIYDEVNESDWNAILIMAPVYSDKVPQPTENFIDGLTYKGRVFLLATSGDSEFTLDSDTVDSVTSVSLKTDQAGTLIRQVVSALNERLRN